MEPLTPLQTNVPAQTPVEPQPPQPPQPAQPIRPIQPVQPIPQPLVNQVPIQPAVPATPVVPGVPMTPSVAQVTFPIQVQSAPQQFSPLPPLQPPQQPPKSRFKKIVLILVLLSITSGVAYGMYVYKDTIKEMLPYFGNDVVLTEDNFTSSLMNSFKIINAAEYTVSANISIREREKDTVSMDSKLGSTPEKTAAYKNDYKKLNLASTLFSTLQNPGYSYSSGAASPKYLKDLKELKKKYDDSYSKYLSSENKEANSQLIDSSISYRSTENGSNFELIVSLDTDEAITAYNESYRKFTSVAGMYETTYKSQDPARIDGKKITYTKDTSSKVYIPSELKRPLLSELGYYLKDLPQDFSIAGTSTILSKLVDGQLPEMETGITAEGNFSDLTYKLSIDTILKDKMFYYHIKNFPALGLLGGLSTLKGKWVKVDMDKGTSTNSRYNSDMVGELSIGLQEGLEENKETTKKAMEAFAKSADTSKLITFTAPPSREKLGGENVTKYQFFLKRESLPAFLTALEQESASDPELQKVFIDYRKEIDAMIASPDFIETYDYSKANIFLTMWTRKDGMPIQTQMRMRIIPPVESKNLKDKQIEFILTMNLSKINETITIEAPEGAKTYTEIMGTSSERGYW